MPSGVMQFSDYQEFLALGLTDAFTDGLKLQPIMFDEWLKSETVKRWLDTDIIYSGVGQMPQKGIGSNIQTDTILKGTSKQYSLVPYALGVVLEYEVMRWEQYGIFEDLGPELARAATERYNVVAYSLLNNAFSAPNATYQTYQSEDLIDVAHTRLDEGTWSNRQSGNPGLSHQALQQTRIDLNRSVNERGKYGMLTPTLLIVPPELGPLAEEILNSTGRSDVANPAVYNTEKGKLRVHESPFLTSATAWFIICDKNRVRVKMRYGDKATLSRDSDFRNKNMLMSTYCSFNVASYNSLGWYGSDGLNA